MKTGPIGAVLGPLFQPERELATELADASSLCGACAEACPVKIPLHDMLVALRARNADVVAKIPSDCPLIDPRIIDRVVGVWRAAPDAYDLSSARACRTGSIRS